MLSDVASDTNCTDVSRLLFRLTTNVPLLVAEVGALAIHTSSPRLTAGSPYDAVGAACHDLAMRLVVSAQWVSAAVSALQDDPLDEQALLLLARDIDHLLERVRDTLKSFREACQAASVLEDDASSLARH